MAEGRARSTRPRADALRNRARIMAAAADVFAEQGPEAALDEIAKRADVGNATVYRHFADRGVLLHEVVLGVLTRAADEAERAADEEPDPFAALHRFVHAMADERVAILCPLLAGSPAAHGVELEAQKERVLRGVDAVVTRAQRAGRMREDVSSGDLLMTLAQLTRPLPGASWVDVDRFSHRNLDVYLDGLCTPAPAELPGRPAGIQVLRPGQGCSRAATSH